MFFNIIVCLRIFGAKIVISTLFIALWGVFFKEKAKNKLFLGMLNAFSPKKFVARMMFDDFASQPVGVHVGVNFCCSDAFMP